MGFGVKKIMYDVVLHTSTETGEVNDRWGWTQGKEVGVDLSLHLC